MNGDKGYKCPHCGELFTAQECRQASNLIPTHDWPKPCRSVCPGTRKSPLIASSKRTLWKDLRVCIINHEDRAKKLEAALREVCDSLGKLIADGNRDVIDIHSKASAALVRLASQ